MALVRLVKSADHDFVHYCVTSPEHGRAQLTEFAYGAGKPGLNLTNIKEVWFGLPPLEEQTEIVKRVEKLFKLADQIEQRYHTAKAFVDKLPQAILAKAFQGELVPQDPTDEPASVLLERIQAERAEREAVAKAAKKAKRKTTSGKAKTGNEQGRKPKTAPSDTAVQLNLDETNP
ncbi:MAG: hypothetical protein F6K30_13460 [Cyanothece sp. SIO2G6]|nr:hypothetical protein [Cyanothece sp. SIO2G6]